MKKMVLVRYGEIILKGYNRPVFEDALVNNIRKAIEKEGEVKISNEKAHSGNNSISLKNGYWTASMGIDVNTSSFTKSSGISIASS